jgi:aminopeptidase C
MISTKRRQYLAQLDAQLRERAERERLLAAAQCSTSAMVYEMQQVVYALNRLALVIPPEHAALGHEANTIATAFDGRIRAIQAMMLKT